MEINAVSGLLLVVAGGIFSGSFSLPFKYNRTWAWENNWLVWSLVALVAAPWAVALCTVPGLWSAYAAAPATLGLVAFFGLVWGVGAITFGLGIDYLGIALSMPLMLGLNNAIGTLMPILARDPAQLATPTGLKICAGVGIIVAGIALYSLAGGRKQKLQQSGGEAPKGGRSRFAKGLLICLLAGIFGPMVNFAFVYGAPIQQHAVAGGASPIHASNAIWSVALTAGFLINLVYCLRLLGRNGTSANYRTARPANWLMAALAGGIWYLSIMLYGMGSSGMGALGASVGWATMQTLAILTGNLAGIFAGEWRGAPGRVLALMYGGLALMIAGVLTIAFS